MHIRSLASFLAGIGFAVAALVTCTGGGPGSSSTTGPGNANAQTPVQYDYAVLRILPGNPAEAQRMLPGDTESEVLAACSSTNSDRTLVCGLNLMGADAWDCGAGETAFFIQCRRPKG